MESKTEIIQLPVTGSEAEIREGDGAAEDILTGRQALFEAIPAYLAYFTVRIDQNTAITENEILDLPVPDQEFLAVHIYILDRGEILNLRDGCVKCGEPAGVQVDLPKLDLKPLPEDAIQPDPVFSVKLPRSGETATFGYLTGRQENTLLKRRINGRIDASSEMYEFLRSVGDVSKPDLKLSHVRGITGRDRAALRAAIEKAECGYDSRVRWRCQCGAPNITNVLTDTGFFFPAV